MTSASQTMRVRNAAYAKNVLKRGHVNQPVDEKRSQLSAVALYVLVFVVLGSALFQLFNLI